MGREAKCVCHWADQTGLCTALIEPPELILRGVIRKRVAIALMTGLAVRSEHLSFSIDGDQVSLELGKQVAERWKRALEAPVPTLAAKLGLNPESEVLVIGDVESEELQGAMDTLGSTDLSSNSFGSPSMILLIAQTPAELATGLVRATAFRSHPPIWVVYPKGSKSTLPEEIVRNKLRGLGYMDTKVAAVSPTLTALRFNRQT